MRENTRLKLKAVAAEDVEVLSALLQDGLVVASDLHYQKEEASFSMVINRYCWEETNNSKAEAQPYRCLCGVKISNVKQVSQRGFSGGANQFYNLLSIVYEGPRKNEEAENMLTFTFSDGYGIRLTLDKLALIVQDIAEPHPGLAQPFHN